MQAPRIALLIDFDNVILGVEDPPGFDIELVVNALRSRGVVVLGRAYGDWYRHHRHRRKLMDHGIELVETPAFGPIIKNSADIRIALDGFEIGMTQHHITEICLVSGDSDFLPLIKRLQYLGKTVSVISGVKFTSELVRRNCNEFISYENLLADSVGATEDATVLEGAFALLVRTISTLHDRGMEVRSSTVKQMMIQLNPVFSERTFGCAQFKQFLDKACRAGKIKLGTRDPNSGEYNVLLPGDFDEKPTESVEETAAPEAEKAARPPRRARGRRVQNSGEDLTLESVAPESQVLGEESAEAPTSTPDTEDAREAASRENSARDALRKGRLRSSGRTWKGKATATRSVLQGAVNGATQAESTPSAESGGQVSENSAQVTAPPSGDTEKAVETLVAQDGGAVAEIEAKTETEEKPKRTSRHRRKPAEPKTAEAQSDSQPSNEAKTEAVKANEPKSEDAKTEEPKPEPKKAAKKSRSRKAAVPKASDEAASTPDVPVAPEPSTDTEPVEEKKAAKKPTRRRTPRKKTEEPSGE